MKRWAYFCGVLLILSSCQTYQIGKNPAAMLKNEQQAHGIVLTESNEPELSGLLYFLDYNNDYQLDKFINSNIRGINDFKRYAGTKILSFGKVLANIKKLKYGCSAFVCQSQTGDILYGRNFDFTSDGPAPVVVASTHPHDGYKSISIISMSLLKYPKGSLSDGKTDLSILAAIPYLLMDGMNEKGLAVSVLYLDPSDTINNIWYGGTEQYDRKKHDIMTSSAMRLVLDRASSVDEALNLLNQYNMFANGKKNNCSYHFLIGDKTGNSVVLEYIPADGKWVMCPVNTNFATNFYVHPELYGVGHGQDRFGKLKAKLKETNNILSEREAMTLLQTVSQEPSTEKTSNTQWSVVYNLSQGTYCICIGRNYNKFVYGSL